MQAETLKQQISAAKGEVDGACTETYKSCKCVY